MGSLKKDRYFLQSLASGISVLEVIADSDCPLSLSEIARHLNTSKTTATRICHTLSELQLLQKNENNKYFLTPKNLKFGYGAIRSIGWRNVAKFYLEHLSKELQETISLTILDGTEVMFLLRIRHGDFFPFDAGIGTKLPAHCAATGKAILAFMSPDKRQSALDMINFRSLTVHSIKSVEEFNAELAKIKEDGYALNYEEVSIGVCGVAAPIVDIDGQAIAAISISSSTAKYSRHDLEIKLVPEVVRTANQISEALGQMELTKIA